MIYVNLIRAWVLPEVCVLMLPAFGIFRQIESRLGCELLNAYGLVESCSIATMTRIGDPEDVRLRTVGRPVPGVEIKIVDTDRREIPRGASTTGELAVRGFIMKGYYGNPDKTAEVVDDDGWLYTGDLARWFDKENVSIVGRCKDMVIRGGFNVYPSDASKIGRASCRERV